MSAISEQTYPIEKSAVADESRAARKRIMIIGGGVRPRHADAISC